MKASVLILLVAGLVGLSTVAAASAAQNDRISAQIHKSSSVVEFFDNHPWMRATRRHRCASVPWERTCFIARQKYAKHAERLARLKREAWQTLPVTNDWRTAVEITQRVFPGTESWLLFISDREGGWGPFVMNHQGSGAGGWMQFMESTFYAYSDAARRAVAARGFNVSPDVFVWTHPLGQALTAGYMRYYGRDGCHWCL